MAKEAQAPTKVPQPRGGFLNSGGTPGNPGGGRPPNRIRLKAREILEDDGMPRLQEIIKSKESSEGTVVAACRTLSDLGVPKQHEQTITLNNAVVYDAWADCVGEKLGPVVLAELQALVKERLPENWQGD